MPCLLFIEHLVRADGKESACNAADPGSIPGSGKFCGEGNGNPLQYSCPENPMDRAAWWATVHQVAKSQTGLKRLNTHSTYERMANLTQKGEIQGMCVCGG